MSILDCSSQWSRRDHSYSCHSSPWECASLSSSEAREGPLLLPQGAQCRATRAALYVAQPSSVSPVSSQLTPYSQLHTVQESVLNMKLSFSEMHRTGMSCLTVLCERIERAGVSGCPV